MTTHPDPKEPASSFKKQVEQKSPSVISEFWGLLRYNKKWWLAPIIIVSLILGVLLLLLGTPVAPLIYTLF